MKKQPAYVNYCFKGGYVELGKTIKTAFRTYRKEVGNCCDQISDIWEDVGLLGSFGDLLAYAFTFGESGEVDFENMFGAILFLIKLSFNIVKMICVSIVSLIITVIFSIIHSILLFVFLAITYVFFVIIWFADTLFCGLKKIATSCPRCQHKYSLPTYVCTCGRQHTKLKPSKYGILTRKCLCGRKIKTTFFNGRGKLPGKWICPNCSYNIKEAMHTDIPIPVIGGHNSGKTCYINMAIQYIGQVVARKKNMVFQYQANDELGDDFEANIQDMKQGRLPVKTFDTRLKYYQFYLTPKNKKVKNLISICDIAGEAYDDNKEIGRQIGFKNASGFIMIVDPLSVREYREKVKNEINLNKYGISTKPMDEVLSALISTLENINCISAKTAIKTYVAVVFSKLDIPGLDAIIGDEAINNYLKENPKKTRLEAQNILCEKFLIAYEEVNFLTTLKSKFKNIQFFTTSALGHVTNGKQFDPQKVEEPIFWLLGNISKNFPKVK